MYKNCECEYIYIRYDKSSKQKSHQRLKVQQTLFGQSVGFSIRTFRFLGAGSSSDAQQQTITCDLHLESISDVAEEQADNCSCYTQEQCDGYNF